MASSSKKKAELSATAKMIDQIENIIRDETEYYDTTESIYVLIDIENIYLGNFFDQRQFSTKIIFIGFTTTNHPSINVAPTNVISIKTINSDRRDECDILMIGIRQS